MTKMTPALPASLAPSPSRLHKPQCHPVALADRLVLRVVRVVVVVARRQGPHAVGVVLGVLRVGVDLALRIEREAEIGRAHVWTPVTNAHLVCRLMLEKKKQSTHRHE